MAGKKMKDQTLVQLDPQAGEMDQSTMSRNRESRNRDTTGQLRSRIKSRIEKRLGERIRNLRVVIKGQTICLTGRCSTYYSKQLAQHAALGVIEDQQLENAIEVRLPH